MEETHALLAKLVNTKCVEKALAPIAAQPKRGYSSVRGDGGDRATFTIPEHKTKLLALTRVSQLIILNEAYENGDDAAVFPSNLVASGTAVQRSTQALVNVARQLAHQSPDEVLCRDMPRACDFMSAAGENLVTATQRAHAENLSTASRRHLLRCAKDLLEATLKVLLVTDDAEVRKIVRAGQWLKDKLGHLTTVTNIKQLVPAFKSFTEALMLYTNLVDKRQLDLICRRQREAVVTHMATLKKAVPMLSSAMQTYTKYPQNTQAKSSKDYAVGAVLECVEDVVAIMENGVVDGEESEESEEPGHFVTTIDKALSQLSEDERFSMCVVGSDLDQTMEAAVRHSMGVAHLSSDQHRQLIIKNCQRIMRERSRTSELVKNVGVRPAMEEVVEDFGEACEGLMQDFQDLERHVAASVTQLLVDVYWESTQPLDRLIQAALTQTSHEEDLEDLSDVFHDHSDRMCQVARFAAASSDQSKRVCIIRGCVTQLERLDPELVPAVMTCRREPANRAALEHLRLLKTEWQNNVTVLINTLDHITDVKLFIHMAELDIRDVISQCKNSLYDEPAQIQLVTRNLIGRCRRLAVVGKNVLESSEDPLYRNLLKIYVTQLNKLLHAVKSASNNVIEQPTITDLHVKLQKRCDILMKCVSKLREAVYGEDQQNNTMQNNGMQPTSGVLDFDVGEDEEERAISDSAATKASAAAHEANKHQQQAVRAYIAELTSSEIAELVQAVTSAAIGGQQDKLSLLGNDVLTRGNRVCEQANCIIACTENSDTKQHLQDVVAKINSLTSRVLSTSNKVCDCDTKAVEEMHGAAENWGKQVSYLESFLDGIIQKWKAVSDKVVNAAKMANVPLLTAQVQLVRAHSVYLSGLASTARKLADPADLVCSEHAQLMQSAADDFENQTTMLVTLADCSAKTDMSSSGRVDLEVASREWACAVHSATCRLDVTAVAALHTLGRSGGENVHDYSQTQEKLKGCRGETMRLKGLVMPVVERSSEKHHDRSTALLAQCDKLLTGMDDESAHLTTSSHHGTPAMYAPHAWRLLYWQWARMVHEVHALYDDVTKEYGVDGENFMKAGKDSSFSTPPSPASSLLSFRQRWGQCRAKVLEALQGHMDDPGRKQEVKGHLDELNDIMAAVEELLEKHTDGEDNVSLDLSFLLRQWAGKCQLMMATLTSMPGTNQQAVEAARSLLNPPPASPPSVVVHGSNEPWWKTRRKTQQHQQQQATPHNLTLQDLTGSLLDFADDLLDFDLEETADLDPDADQSAGFFSADDREKAVAFCPQEEIGISMWIEEEEEEEEKISTKTLVAADSTLTADSNTSKDTSYKNLSRGPKIAHTTPIKSSPDKMYKPPKKVVSFFEPRTGSPPISSSLLPRPMKSGFMLSSEVDKWEDDNNPIVTVAKEMSDQLQNMADYTHQCGPIESRAELIATAKLIAKNGSKLTSFAKILAQYCVDKRCCEDLSRYCNYVPTVIAQLSILASVKATSDDERSSEKQLLATAQNLVTAINKMLTAAEGACVRGFKEVSGVDESQALILATKWRRRFNQHRRIETNCADTDNLGLRKVNQNSNRPALSQIRLGKGVPV